MLGSWSGYDCVFSLLALFFSLLIKNKCELVSQSVNFNVVASSVDQSNNLAVFLCRKLAEHSVRFGWKAYGNCIAKSAFFLILLLLFRMTGQIYPHIKNVWKKSGKKWSVKDSWRYYIATLAYPRCRLIADSAIIVKSFCIKSNL